MQIQFWQIQLAFGLGCCSMSALLFCWLVIKIIKNPPSLRKGGPGKAAVTSGENPAEANLPASP